MSIYIHTYTHMEGRRTDTHLLLNIRAQQ